MTYYYDTDDERPIDIGFQGPFFEIVKSPPSEPVSASADGPVDQTQDQEHQADEQQDPPEHQS